MSDELRPAILAPASPTLPKTRRAFTVSWSAVDPLLHMRNTAYFDAANDTRLSYLDASGWSPERFDSLRIGPITFDERIRYRRELRLRQEFIVSLELAGVSMDASRFRLRSRFLDARGRNLAELTSEMGWLDITARKVANVPYELSKVIIDLPHTPDFRELTARRREAAPPPRRKSLEQRIQVVVRDD
jgi:acyl-CoA thioester hydrolase